MRSCLLQVLAWAVVAVALGLWLRAQRDAGLSVWGFAIGAALLITAAVSLSYSIAMTMRERRGLLSADGSAPVDGSWSAVCGTITSRSPLRSPLSGVNVVAYEYSIHRTEGTGKHRSEVVYFDGKALAPSVIATAGGSMRLLAVPQLEGEYETCDVSRSMANARSYLRQATFADRETGAARTAALEAEWADDDGQFRIDRKHVKDEVTLDASFQYDERLVRQGETVCAFGVYSAERGGLVPDTRWGRTIRLARGDATASARRLLQRAIGYAMGAAVCAAGAAGVVMVYLQRG